MRPGLRVSLLTLATTLGACGRGPAPHAERAADQEAVSKQLGAARQASGSLRSDASAPRSAGSLGRPGASARPDAVDQTDAEAGEPVTPRVDLAGRHHPAPARAAQGPRLHVRSMRAWVHQRPARDAPRLGYLRLGAWSPTSDRPAGTSGCRGGWYPVQPRGFVCRGRRVTLDPTDPVVRAAAPYPPRFDRKLPYIYGTVRRPGPVYQRLPTRDEVRQTEKGHDDRMQAWLELKGENGASYAQHVWEGNTNPDLVAARSPHDAWRERRSDSVPAFLAPGRTVPNVRRYRDWDAEALVRRRMGAKVGHSILTTLFHEGRRYAVASDFLLLPADRLRPIQGSRHIGFRVGVEVQLPFAIVRKKFARFTVVKDGKVRRGEPAPYFSALPLTGKKRYFRIRYGGRRRRVLHYETRSGTYIADRYASLVEGVKRLPKWGKRGERWIDISLNRQLLRAYEGDKLVYATLISSGEAGLEDPEHTTATKRGIFRIHTKHVTATMSSDEVGEAFELRDVPFVQYFDKAGYAIHGAYWHDRFGTPKSHGCINLTPEDARRLFFWTSPRLPDGWHGRLKRLTGTVVFIHP